MQAAALVDAPKRIFSRGDLTIARLEEIYRIARIDFAELAGAVGNDTQA